MEKKGALTDALELMGIDSLSETDFQLGAMLRDGVPGTVGVEGENTTC